MSTAPAKRKRPVFGIAVNLARDKYRETLDGLIKGSEAHPGPEWHFFFGSYNTTLKDFMAFAESGLDGIVDAGISTDIAFQYLERSPNHPPLVVMMEHKLTKREDSLLGEGGAVTLDNAMISTAAADFFISKGFVNYAFYGLDQNSEHSRLRCATFAARIREKVPRARFFFEKGTCIRGELEDIWDEGTQNLEKWVIKLPKPCAVLSVSEFPVYHLLKACRATGTSIPHQLSLVGLHVSPFDELNPSLTSFNFDYALAGKKLVEMLCDIMVCPSLPKTKRRLDFGAYSFIERDSTAGLSDSGRIVNKAKSFIRDTGIKAVSVADVAKALNISRRSLEMHFRKCTGRSVYDEIQHNRLSLVRHYLERTDLPITQIAFACGYEQTSNLGVTFKKHFGMTMSDYRLKMSNLSATE